MSQIQSRKIASAATSVQIGIRSPEGPPLEKKSSNVLSS